MNRWIITYLEGGKQRIYAFVKGANGQLAVNFWDGDSWRWADQGAPPGTTVADGPGVITYLEGGKQRIYAFVRGANGQLAVNFWDGDSWRWADQGAPPGTTVADGPGVITYLEGGKQRIYAFVRGANGQLAVNFWDGDSWRWADQGAPPGTTVADGPGVITYLEGGKQRIYAFVRGANGRLAVNFWDGDSWRWADQGAPPGTTVADAPGVITYLEGGKQRIYAFVRGANGRLAVNFWDGDSWRWADQGAPPGTTVADGPGVITYLEGGKQRIYAFVRGANGRLAVNFWDGDSWRWADQGAPPGTTVADGPGVITYLEGSKQRMYAFVRGANGQLAVNFWDGDSWSWADVNVPAPIPVPTSVSFLAPTSGIVGTLISVEGAGFTPSHSVTFDAWNVSTTFVSATQLQFRVPQRPVATHNVTVGGVGPQSFSLTAGTLSVSPSSINLPWGSNVPLSVSLPLAAPSGGVNLTATAAPTGIIRIADHGRLNYPQGHTSDTVLITPEDVGSGTIEISGDGYTTTSVSFTVSMGTPQCTVRARAQGGVEFVNLISNNVMSSLPSAQVPGRIAIAPGGARAVVQYLNGIAFVDLVNCRSLGRFQTSTIPLNNFSFSSDGRFFAADWFHATQNDGLVAYKLVDGTQLFSRNTTSNSLNVLIQGDSTGVYAFWVSSINTAQGAQPQLGIYSLSDAPASCFLGSVPSNNISVSMTGGVATIQFMGIAQPQTWHVRAANCIRLP